MKRPLANDRPLIERVTHIEIPEGRIKLRIALLVIALIIAVGSFGYGINALLTTEPGVMEITVSDGGEMTCGDDFSFVYDLGAGETSATEEKKALTKLYSESCIAAYRIFNAEAEYEDHKNLCYINAHVNEVIEVDPALYGALMLLEDAGVRYHYLAPVYELYRSLFLSEEPEAAEYDPYRNEVLKTFFAEAAAYAADPGAVSLEFLDGNMIVLHVSDAYLRFAEENDFDRFLDFFWLNNAFIIDYIADELTAKGYVNGSLISEDGFVRQLRDADEAVTAVPFLHRGEEGVFLLETLPLTGRISVVQLRDYPAESAELGYYFVREDGSCLPPYIDARSGLPKCALPELIAFSEDASCAKIAVEAAKIFIAETFDEAALHALSKDGIDAYYFGGGALRCTAE